MSNGEPVDSCKYGYPRRLGVTETELNTETSRYEYKCAEEEDRKLSPYIPLWSLAWGASMNVQWCTGPGYLSYISKYVTKIEPYGLVEQPRGLSDRDAQSPGYRFIQARTVGIPEAVFRVFQFPMREGMGVVHLITKPPETRKRALANHSARSAAEASPDDPIALCDGIIEQYMKRPVGVMTPPPSSLRPSFPRSTSTQPSSWSVTSRVATRVRSTSRQPAASLPYAQRPTSAPLRSKELPRPKRRLRIHLRHKLKPVPPLPRKARNEQLRLPSGYNPQLPQRTPPLFPVGLRTALCCARAGL